MHFSTSLVMVAMESFKFMDFFTDLTTFLNSYLKFDNFPTYFSSVILAHIYVYYGNEIITINFIIWTSIFWLIMYRNYLPGRFKCRSYPNNKISWKQNSSLKTSKKKVYVSMIDCHAKNQLTWKMFKPVFKVMYSNFVFQSSTMHIFILTQISFTCRYKLAKSLNKTENFSVQASKQGKMNFWINYKRKRYKI